MKSNDDEVNSFLKIFEEEDDVKTFLKIFEDKDLKKWNDIIEWEEIKNNKIKNETSKKDR